MTAIDAGSTLRRYSWWRRSSVPAMSSSGRPASASMSTAAREVLNRASVRGTESGRALRASSVLRRVAGGGTRRLTGNDPSTGMGAARGAPSASVQATVAPPKTAGATLSGCPSKPVAMRNTSSAGRARGSESRPRASMRPATTAEADEPMPPPCGMRLTQCISKPACGAPTASRPARRARTTRLSSPVGTAPSPAPSTCTRVVPTIGRTSTSS